MNNQKVGGIKIPRFQSGTRKEGVQKRQTWTSEDIDNPVYSKKKPLSIKEQKQIFIKDRQEQGARNFDKGMRIGFGVARLHPTYGIGMNIVDMIDATKRGDFPDYVSNMFGATGKVTTKLGNHTANPTPSKNPRVNFRNKRAKPMGLPLKGLGYIMSAQDYINDAVDLYNTIRE